MPAVALALLVLRVRRHGSLTHKPCSWEESRAFTPDSGQCCSATRCRKTRSEEAYLGVSGKTVTVRTAMDGPACGFHFVEGERYVIFGSRTPIGLHVSLCSRTRPAKNAADDIAYLRSLPSLQKTALIQGTLWRYTHDPSFKPKFEPSLMDHYRPPEQYYRSMEPVSGAAVIVRSKDAEEQRATVGQDGNWQLAELTPGEYSIQVPVDDRMNLHFFRDKVTIAEKGCAEVNLRIEPNGD